MKRYILCTLILSLLFCGACSSNTTKQNAKPEGKIHHVVLCWLKDPGNTTHRETIIQASKAFEDIPTVLSVSVGNVLASERELVDDSFDVGLIVTFNNKQDMEEYIAHPLHVKMVEEKLKPLVKQIAVYDIVE